MRTAGVIFRWSLWFAFLAVAVGALLIPARRGRGTELLQDGEPGMTALDPWGWADLRRKHRIRVWAIVALLFLSGVGACGFVVHREGWDCVESQLRGYLWMTTNCGPGEVGAP